MDFQKKKQIAFLDGFILDKMTTSNRTCEFCDEINGQLFDYSEFNITPKFGSRIIQSEKYPLLTVMPDRSPLLPGHSLICSKDHFTSFSDFNRFHNCSVVELFNIILRLSSMSVNNFSVEGLLFFEHGGNSCVKPNGCVDHAHIHIIPVNKIFYGKLQESLFYKYGLDEIISCSSLRKTYNFIQSKNNINEYVMIGYASKKNRN